MFTIPSSHDEQEVSLTALRTAFRFREKGSPVYTGWPVHFQACAAACWSQQGGDIHEAHGALLRTTKPATGTSMDGGSYEGNYLDLSLLARLPTYR